MKYLCLQLQTIITNTKSISLKPLQQSIMKNNKIQVNPPLFHETLFDENIQLNNSIVLDDKSIQNRSKAQYSQKLFDFLAIPINKNNIKVQSNGAKSERSRSVSIRSFAQTQFTENQYYYTFVGGNPTNFFIQKLRRIIYNYMRKQLRCIRQYRKQYFNLKLIEGKNKRSLRLAFFQLKALSQQFKQQKINRNIQGKKNPILVMQSTKKLFLNKKRDVFFSIKQYSLKNQKIQNFIQKLFSVLQNGPVKFLELKVYRQIAFCSFLQKQKKQAAKDLSRILPLVMRRHKKYIFQGILNRLVGKDYSSVLEMKSETNKKKNQAMNDRGQNMNRQRQVIRAAKYTIDSENAQRNRVKRQSIMQANTKKQQLKQLTKKSTRSIAELQKNRDKLVDQLSTLEHKNQKRIKSLTVSKGIRQTMLRMYEKLNNASNISRKTLLKSHSSQQLQPFDEYHLYENQNLRQLLNVYQKNNGQKIKVQGQELYDSILMQNKKLKQLLSLMFEKEMVKYCTRDLIQKSFKNT